MNWHFHRSASGGHLGMRLVSVGFVILAFYFPASITAQPSNLLQEKPLQLRNLPEFSYSYSSDEYVDLPITLRPTARQTAHPKAGSFLFSAVFDDFIVAKADRTAHREASSFLFSTVFDDFANTKTGQQTARPTDRQTAHPTANSFSFSSEFDDIAEPKTASIRSCLAYQEWHSERNCLGLENFITHAQQTQGPILYCNRTFLLSNIASTAGSVYWANCTYSPVVFGVIECAYSLFHQNSPAFCRSQGNVTPTSNAQFSEITVTFTVSIPITLDLFEPRLCGSECNIGIQGQFAVKFCCLIRCACTTCKCCFQLFRTSSSRRCFVWNECASSSDNQ